MVAAFSTAAFLAPIAAPALAALLLADIYGLMTGVLRRTSRGLLIPWAAHVLADMTTVGILAWLAVGS